jgi:hypothetical protein
MHGRTCYMGNKTSGATCSLPGSVATCHSHSVQRTRKQPTAAEAANEAGRHRTLHTIATTLHTTAAALHTTVATTLRGQRRGNVMHICKGLSRTCQSLHAMTGQTGQWMGTHDSKHHTGRYAHPLSHSAPVRQLEVHTRTADLLTQPLQQLSWLTGVPDCNAAVPQILQLPAASGPAVSSTSWLLGRAHPRKHQDKRQQCHTSMCATFNQISLQTSLPTFAGFRHSE